MDLSPTSVLRFVLIWAVGMLALSGLSERRTRQQLVGMLFRTVFPLLLFGLLMAIPLLVPERFPQWWDRWWRYVVPLSTLLFGLVLWLPQQGKRLSWSGYWEFRDPAQGPATGTGGLARPRQTGLRVLGYLMMLAGVALTTVPALVVQRPEITPDWVEPNGFLIGVTGLFTVLYGGKTLKLARTRQARALLSRPIRGDAWMGSLLWVVAWLCCLVGLVLTLGGLSVMMEPLDLAWWQTFLALWTMILGGFVFTQGRKTFLRARRHRSRLIPNHRHLEAGSYVLYLRSFEADERQTTLHEVPVPGIAGGAMVGFVVSGRSAEEHVADILRPVAPLVAVGAPGERLPHVGAVRMYLPHEAWQETVRELMRRSRLTALTLGTSEGTMWELTEAVPAAASATAHPVHPGAEEGGVPAHPCSCAASAGVPPVAGHSAPDCDPRRHPFRCGLDASHRARGGRLRQRDIEPVHRDDARSAARLHRARGVREGNQHDARLT